MSLACVPVHIRIRMKSNSDSGTMFEEHYSTRLSLYSGGSRISGFSVKMYAKTKKLGPANALVSYEVRNAIIRT